MAVRFKRLAALLLAAVLCLALCACGEREESPAASISLWFTWDNPLSGQLQLLVQDYNASLGPDDATVTLRAFDDEESLAAAYELLAPDLLLCSHVQASRLYEQGLLRDTGVPFDYGGLDEIYSPCIGSSFYPLGYEALLLYAADGAFAGGTPDGLEDLLRLAAEYGEAERLPFFTASSYAALLYDMVLSLGSEFHAVRARDLGNADYVNAYNRLAEAAFSGALGTPGHPGSGLVRARQFPCAAVFSTELAGLTGDGFSVVPLPRLSSDPDYLATAYGLAVTARADGDLAPVEAFLRWLLEPQRLCAAAVSAGLVPAASGSIPDGSPLASALLELARQGRPHFPAPGCDYYANRDRFEAELRRALELLR